MNYQLFKLPLLLWMLSSFLPAVTYFDGEDETTGNWRIYDDTPSGATIENIEDENSRVIKLQGSGRANSYMLGNKREVYDYIGLDKKTKHWRDKDNHILSWRMKTDEKFRMTIYTVTRKGLRVFHVTHHKKDKGLYKKKYIGIGIGKKSINGTWQNYSLNLRTILQKYEPSNDITIINGIKFRGSALLDDIQTSDGVVNHVKDICTNHKVDENVICLEEYNRAYYLKRRSSYYTVKFLHTINTEGEWKEVDRTYIDGGKTINKLENTPLIYLTTYPIHHETLFYHSNMEDGSLHKILSIRTKNKKNPFIETPFRIDNIESREEGKKLVVKLHNLYTEEDIHNSYDISNLPEIPRVFDEM